MDVDVEIVHIFDDEGIKHLENLYELYEEFDSCGAALDKILRLNHDQSTVTTNCLRCGQFDEVKREYVQELKNSREEVEVMKSALLTEQVKNEKLQLLFDSKNIKHSDEILRFQEAMEVNKEKISSLSNELEAQYVELSALKENLEFYMDQNTQLKNKYKVVQQKDPSDIISVIDLNNRLDQFQNELKKQTVSIANQVLSYIADNEVAVDKRETGTIERNDALVQQKTANLGGSKRETGTMERNDTSVQQMTANPGGSTVKFEPPIVFDDIHIDGMPMEIPTKSQCIAVMDYYQSKSIEEIRLEDYELGRRTGQVYLH